MSAPPFDPLTEQRLIEEVIYLHSLWHRGPPRPAAGAPAGTTSHHRLPPSGTTQFKPDQRQHRGKRGGTNRSNDNLNPQSIQSSGAEWPCPATPPPETTTTGWAIAASTPVKIPELPSPEDQLKFAVKKAQNKALNSVRDFFKVNNVDSGSDSDSDDEFMEEEEEDELRHYTFFLKVLTEESELREFYEKNFAKSEFNCLVCGALGGKNVGKKYKGCLALVQHSISIAKTKKKRAHRAFGQAVCKVLGWDIDRLPTIASMLSDDLPEGNDSNNSKDNSVDLVDNVEPVDAINLGVLHESEPIGCEILPSGNEGNMNSPIGADGNYTALENLTPVPVEKSVAGELTSVLVNEKNGVGIEIQESANAILDELKEDNRTNGTESGNANS